MVNWGSFSCSYGNNSCYGGLPQWPTSVPWLHSRLSSYIWTPINWEISSVWRYSGFSSILLFSY